ncbi:hypothetical protein BJ741DRAFT_292707 [Chytriomyces cf. hyalinus JEL632]|nr:hypothetical protein BJ741DRAFT_292707 [Chytriomyces cf. hyalinus JEL632]
MRSPEPPPKDEDWPLASSPPPQLSTLRPSYTYPVFPAHPSYPINMLSETSSVSSNDSCQMDVTSLQRLHLDDVDKRPFPSILPLVQPMETLHEERFSPNKDNMKDELDLTQFWVGSAPASAAVTPNNQSHNFFFNIISPSPVTSPLMSPYAQQSGGFLTQERVSTVSTETLFHEPRLSLSSPMYSGQQPPLQQTPNKTIQHRDSLQTLSKGSTPNRSSPISHHARLLSDESLVMGSEESEKYSTWKRMFKKTVRKDTIGSRESASTLNSSTATVLNTREALVNRHVEASEEKTPKGFKRFLKKTAAFFRSSNNKSQKKDAAAVLISKPDSNVRSNSALSLSFDSKPSTLTQSSSKETSNKSSAKTQPQSTTTPRKSPFSSIDFEFRDQARLKSTTNSMTNPIVSTETMESLDRGRLTWKLLGTSNQLKTECLYASVLAKNENLLCASYNSSLLRPSNTSSSCATGGCGCGSLRDYYASSDGGSQNASMDRAGGPTDSGIKNANFSPSSIMKRNYAAQYRAGNGLATMDPRLTLERLSSTVSIPAAESLEASGRSRSSPAVVISIGGFQDLKLTVGLELAKLYYDICVSGLDVDEIAERAASGEYLSDEEE